MAFTKVQSGFIDLSTSSGLSVGTGTSSAPAINFGTSNTGLLGDSDEVAISVSGSRILTAKSGNLGVNTSSPSHRLEVAGTTRTSFLSLPSPGSGNAAISIDTFNAANIISRTTATGSGTNLGLIYSSATPYLAHHMTANTDSGTYAEYPLRSSSSSPLKRGAIIVGNHGIALGTGLTYTGTVNGAIPHTHFTYNLHNSAGDLVLNQHTPSGDNTGNRGIFFRVSSEQVMPFTTYRKGLINFKRTTTNGRGQLDFHLDAGDDANSVTVSDTTSLSLAYDQNTVGLPTEFGPANKYGDVDQGNNSGPTVDSGQLAKGKHYIQLQSNHSNNENNSNDPAWIAWKGSTARGETSGGSPTTVPFGGYCARIGGYRDKVNDGSTSIGWETVQNVATLPHTMTRQMTLRYNGKIAMGNNIEPDCHLDMGSVNTAIRVPNGTTAQRPSTSGTAGQLRYNTETTNIEYSNGSAWGNLGGLVPISSTTVSSEVSAVSFTEALDGAFSTYKIYVVMIDNLRFANDDRDLRLRYRTGTNGASLAAGNDYISMTNGAESADSVFSATSFWRMNYNNVGNEVAGSYLRETFNAIFYFHGFAANVRPRYHGTTTYQSSDGNIRGQFVNGTATDSTEVTGLEFFSSSGNIALGKFSLFGVNG